MSDVLLKSLKEHVRRLGALRIFELAGKAVEVRAAVRELLELLEDHENRLEAVERRGRGRATDGVSHE